MSHAPSSSTSAPAQEEDDELVFMTWSRRRRCLVGIVLSPEIVRNAQRFDIIDVRRPGQNGVDDPYIVVFDGPNGPVMAAPANAPRFATDHLIPPDDLHSHMVNTRLLNLEAMAQGQMGVSRLLGASFSALARVFDAAWWMPRSMRNSVVRLALPYRRSEIWDWLAIRLSTLRRTHLYNLFLSNATEETLREVVVEMRGGDPNTPFPPPPDFRPYMNLVNQ